MNGSFWSFVCSCQRFGGGGVQELSEFQVMREVSGGSWSFWSGALVLEVF